MQKTNENSNTTAGRVNDLTSDARKALNLDAIKLCDLPPDREPSKMHNPVREGSSLYQVTTDKMESLTRNAILTKDHLKVEKITFDKLEVDKSYIITDIEHNNYLGLCSSFSDHSITLCYLKDGQRSSVLSKDQIELIELVYSLDRTLINDEELAEIIKAEDEYDRAIESLFTDEQIAAIDSFIAENKAGLGADKAPNTIFAGGPGTIPILKSKRLDPLSMAAEAKNPKTPMNKRIQILEAFKIGYGIMKEFDVPAYRIIFILEHHTDKIVIEFD